MIGSWSVEVVGVRPYSIHGDSYYELHVIHADAPQQVLAVRVPQHAAEQPPQPGDRLTLTFLMGQVTSVKKQ
jgi:hypothetical protein